MKRHRCSRTTTLLLALLLLSACDSVAPDPGNRVEVVLMATEETYVDQRLPGENFDGYLLQVFNYGSDSVMRSYVRFDLSSIPAGATLVEARVELYYFGCEGIDDIAVYAAAGAWKASTLTWNNQPGPTGPSRDVVNLNPGSSFPGDCGATDKYVAMPGGTASKTGWYVTSLAQAWLQGAANDGVVFVAPKSGVQAAFGISESGYNPAYPPRLRLTYEG